MTDYNTLHSVFSIYDHYMLNMLIVTWFAKRDHFCQNVCDLTFEQTTVKTSQTSQFCIHIVVIYP